MPNCEARYALIIHNIITLKKVKGENLVQNIKGKIYPIVHGEEYTKGQFVTMLVDGRRIPVHKNSIQPLTKKEACALSK